MMMPGSFFFLVSLFENHFLAPKIAVMANHIDNTAYYYRSVA